MEEEEIIAWIIKIVKNSSDITEGERHECLNFLGEITKERLEVIELTEKPEIDEEL